MRLRLKGSIALLTLLAGASALSVAGDGVPPVTPDASPEAVSLLKYLYGISGQHTLAASTARRSSAR